LPERQGRTRFIPGEQLREEYVSGQFFIQDAFFTPDHLDVFADDEVLLREVERRAPSPARSADVPPGGIDLNPARLTLQIKRDDNGTPLPIPLQPIPVEMMRIDGFVPVIINITPITNLPMILGVNETGSDTQTIDVGQDPRHQAPRPSVRQAILEEELSKK
jgi:hypothetical protein